VTDARCCARMSDAIDGWREGCYLHEHAHECPDALISVFPTGHGIIVHDGGNSHVAIDYCPWCRADLRVPVAAFDEDGEIEVIGSGDIPDYLINPNPPSDEILAEADRRLREHFGIPEDGPPAGN
jgi:hypothetical protein